MTIIDDCQNVGISAHVEQIKMLAAGVRVLLFNGPMKVSSISCLLFLGKLLSFNTSSLQDPLISTDHLI